jgi:hypothetical protein
LQEAKKQLVKQFSPDSSITQVRSSYNDTDTQKDKENNDSLGKYSFKRKSVEDFIPMNSEEARCQEMASGLKEAQMNWILSALKAYGMGILETAWGRYREDMANGKIIGNPGAYFQGIVKKLTQ